MGYFSQLDSALRADGVVTPAMRYERARQREAARQAEVERLASEGRLCGHCRQFEIEADNLCRSCLKLRQQNRERQAQQQIESAAYRAAASAAGIVVGADVTRVRGGGYGTVIEVGGNYVRVLWRHHERIACPSWCNGRHNRSYVKSLAALKVR